MEVIYSTKALAPWARGMLWAGSRVAWASARPARGWKPGTRFRLLVSSAEGAASRAAGGAGGRNAWSLAWRDVEGSERLGGSLVFLHLQCDSCIALSGKNRFLCNSFTSPSHPACLPREGEPPGKGRGARAETPIALCRGFLLSTSPNLSGRITQESGDVGAGTAACCLKWLLCVFIHLSTHTHTYICKITCRIKHRCHFTLRTQLGERKAPAYQLVAKFFPALSLSVGKGDCINARVYASEPYGPGRARWEGQKVGGEDWVPTCIGGVCCGLVLTQTRWQLEHTGSVLGHSIPCPGMGTQPPGHTARLM